MNEEDRQKIMSYDYADGIIELALSLEEFARYAGISGVNRNPALRYPNREWGYGMVNIYGTFDSLSGE